MIPDFLVHLATRTTRPDRVSKSTNPETLTPADVAAALAGLSGPASDIAWAIYADDVQARRRLARRLLDVALAEGWDDDPETITTLVDMAISSVLDHGICPRCGGHGFSNTKACGRCSGTGRFRPRPVDALGHMGISRDHWYRRWRWRFGLLLDTVNGWQSDLAGHLRAAK